MKAPQAWNSGIGVGGDSLVAFVYCLCLCVFFVLIEKHFQCTYVAWQAETTGDNCAPCIIREVG